LLGHLLDSASNNHHRFVRASIDGQVTMPGYAQREWVDTQNYRDRPWQELQEFWRAFNMHLLHVMRGMPASRLGAAGSIGGEAPVTLEFLMIDYVDHLKHHWGQMCAAHPAENSR